MAASSESDNCRLARAFVSFLKEELKKDDITPDKSESLEVAVQCLKLAYDIPEGTDSTDEPGLMDIYLKAVPAPKEPEPPSEEKLKEAEKLKQEGNEMMKKEEYNGAIVSYTKAIKIDPRNAVYYCNRAAAYTGSGDHNSALADCKKAISIDKNYSKAYSRMGLTYSKLEQYELAVDCYEKALKLDPDNQGYKNNMKIAKDKIQELQSNTPPIPGLGGMADMMNNPAFMNMAQQVLSNPAMQQMAMNMMGSFMGQGGPPAGGNQPTPEGTGEQQTPNMANLLQMGQQFAAQVSQENPELIEQLRSGLNRPDEASDKGDQ